MACCSALSPSPPPPNMPTPFAPPNMPHVSPPLRPLSSNFGGGCDSLSHVVNTVGGSISHTLPPPAAPAGVGPSGARTGVGRPLARTLSHHGGLTPAAECVLPPKLNTPLPMRAGSRTLPPGVALHPAAAAVAAAAPLPPASDVKRGGASKFSRTLSSIAFKHRANADPSSHTPGSGLPSSYSSPRGGALLQCLAPHDDAARDAYRKPITFNDLPASHPARNTKKFDPNVGWWVCQEPSCSPPEKEQLAMCSACMSFHKNIHHESPFVLLDPPLASCFCCKYHNVLKYPVYHGVDMSQFNKGALKLTKSLPDITQKKLALEERERSYSHNPRPGFGSSLAKFFSWVTGKSKFPCSECNGRFSSDRELREHINQVHTGGDGVRARRGSKRGDTAVHAHQHAHQQSHVHQLREPQPRHQHGDAPLPRVRLGTEASGLARNVSPTNQLQAPTLARQAGGHMPSLMELPPGSTRPTHDDVIARFLRHSEDANPFITCCTVCQKEVSPDEERYVNGAEVCCATCKWRTKLEDLENYTLEGADNPETAVKPGSGAPTNASGHLESTNPFAEQRAPANSYITAHDVHAPDQGMASMHSSAMPSRAQSLASIDMPRDTNADVSVGQGASALPPPPRDNQVCEQPRGVETAGSREAGQSQHNYYTNYFY